MRSGGSDSVCKSVQFKYRPPQGLVANYSVPTRTSIRGSTARGISNTRLCLFDAAGGRVIAELRSSQDKSYHIKSISPSAIICKGIRVPTYCAGASDAQIRAHPSSRSNAGREQHLLPSVGLPPEGRRNKEVPSRVYFLRRLNRVCLAFFFFFRFYFICFLHP